MGILSTYIPTYEKMNRQVYPKCKRIRRFTFPSSLGVQTSSFLIGQGFLCFAPPRKAIVLCECRLPLFSSLHVSSAFLFVPGGGRTLHSLPTWMDIHLTCQLLFAMSRPVLF